MHDHAKGNRARPASGMDRISAHSKGAKPEWAGGLRQLYDSVVEEPLPDSFRELLAKLDGKGQ